MVKRIFKQLFFNSEKIKKSFKEFNSKFSERFFFVEVSLLFVIFFKDLNVLFFFDEDKIKVCQVYFFYQYVMEQEKMRMLEVKVLLNYIDDEN